MEKTTKKSTKSNLLNRWKKVKDLEDLRIKAVKLHIKGGMKVTDIVQIMEIWESTLYYRIWVYRKKWLQWLRAKNWKTWRKKDKSINLTAKEKIILRSVLLQEPRQSKKLMLDFGLWTVKYIQHAIKVLFGKSLKIGKTNELLIEMWFTNQKPLFRAYQQNPKKVDEWVNETLPSILQEAKNEWRDVYYWDEAWFRSTNHRWKTRWLSWETPIVSATWARFWVNAISMINARWELKFMAYEWTFTSDTLLMYLKRLLYRNDKKISLILDGHPTHKTKKVQEYLAHHNHQIKLYYLPWYSPELNPDEQVRLHVHNDLKGVIVVNKEQLIAKVRSSLHRQQKQKDKVASYFRHPEVKYYSN